MIIRKLYETETAHRVLNADSIRCSQGPHGHSYRWEIEIAGPVNPETGMLIDFGSLKPIKEMIDKFDHAYIFWDKEDPEIIDFFKKHFKRLIIMRKNVTAENMALWAHRQINVWLQKQFNLNYTPARPVKVRVWETRTGSAIADYSTEEDELVYLHSEE